MSKAMRVHATGGPEVLRWEEVALQAPGPGQALIRHRAIGVNFIDVYHRSGLYPVPLPFVVGSEGAGVVESVGPGVTEVAVGDRVAYGNAPIGAYAEQRLIPADRLVKLPTEIEDSLAASIMLKGMTAWYLIRRTHRVQAGETILMHAAAGGVGLLLCQWAKALGATVIGTVGSQEKARLAREHGCDHTILYREQDVAAEVKRLTGGAGLPVVYDGVGKDTFLASLDCLAPRGLMVSFGNASGAVEPVSVRMLAQKGSLFLTRPTLHDYVRQRDELLTAAEELFEVVSRGAVRVDTGRRYSLADAAQAHRDLEGRQTTGSLVLLP
jgi:NADPH2:quinone reductase